MIAKAVAGFVAFAAIASAALGCVEEPPGVPAPNGVVSPTAAIAVQESNWEVRVLAGAGALRQDGRPAAVAGYRDGPVADALFNGPLDLAVDSKGNVIVADSGNRRIRRITPQGLVETVAGSGEEGSADGPAAKATFRTPVSVAVGPDGTIFVADSEAYVVRAIMPNGDVRTLAGTDFVLCNPVYPKEPGLPQPPAVPKTCAPEYTGSFRDGPAAEALFNSPAGIAVDLVGNVFVSDAGNHRIRRIDSSGNVTTFAGNGETAGFLPDDQRITYPGDLSFGSDGTLFVNEFGSRIRLVSPSGVVSTVAGAREPGYADAVGDLARFAGITGISSSGNGGLLVAESGNQRVRLVGANGNVTTLAGTGGQGMREGPAGSAQFSYPTGIAEVRPGLVYLADSNLGRIFQISVR